MPLNVSYMGTKRQLADQVADVIALSPDGPLLDLFAGMCAVGSAVAPDRNVWCNDIQWFASTVAASFFTSEARPLDRETCEELFQASFEENRLALTERFKGYLNREEDAIASLGVKKLRESDAAMPNVGASLHFEKERRLLSVDKRAFPYRLFSITYSGGYFGLQQSVDIDSIRYAIDTCLMARRITREQHRWLLIALCQAASKVANTTGHFAQYLKVKSSNISRLARQRERSVHAEWLTCIEDMKPIGTKRWRQGNVVTKSDAINLLKKMAKVGDKVPSVIYADPPYTDDQYSRYYHLYETLILYDYPKSAGVGRYRPDRFTSPFSSKQSVDEQMKLLVEGVSHLGSDIVISYPDNGLLGDTKTTLRRLIKASYNHCNVIEIDHRHSSLGASKGIEKQSVTEMIFRGYN
ncbi:MAG: DNA adenine methylase [Ferrovibrio sp.]|uniref:DNA adenine methylase n=1 Tax=Ferrovibrio sp. TaxID=1917215 RepID=UPI0026208AA6|nr:DNA adenine methylase [Ferrovibrio sp.]MCW0234260.1 DNA adenine methylase [Ferrovibrio sp.]